eukprot:m.68597 g.68597  ORF g.68597 m.68597 type:complete len:67 (-) comp23975_c0_seq1:1606-1806(-)
MISQFPEIGVRVVRTSLKPIYERRSARIVSHLLECSILTMVVAKNDFNGSHQYSPASDVAKTSVLF